VQPENEKPVVESREECPRMPNIFTIRIAKEISEVKLMPTFSYYNKLI
jgi:hypothetical protein